MSTPPSCRRCGHTYRVKALYGEAESEVSNYATAVARTPGPPENLTATANEDGSVTLDWDAPDYDGIVGYRIVRRRPSLGEVVLEPHVPDTESTSTSYTDTRVTTGTRHVYRVTAVIVGGRLTEASNSAWAVPLAPPAPAEIPHILGVAGDPTLLRVSVAEIAGAPQDAVFAYQWIGVRGAVESDLAGATSETYRAELADGYDAYRVRVSYTDDLDVTHTTTSPASAIRRHVVSYATGMPDLVSTAPGQAELLRAGTGEVRLLPADGTDQARTNDEPMLLLRFASSIDNIGNGTLSVETMATLDGGRVTYTPDEGFAGGDSFRFEAFDETSDFPRTPTRATVTIEVQAADDDTPTSSAENTDPSPPPLTATLEQVPQTHDGTGEFTVRLILSEEIPLSYTTVRDDVFDVTAGTVVGASRLTRGSNRGWLVSIRPAGAEDVRITVPAGGPCSRTGAICAGDDRPLSTPLQAVVRGP